MNWKMWFHSLAAAAIGGAASSITAAIAVPSAFNFTPQGLENLAKVAVGGALLAVGALLKQSPLPGDTK
ncbi:MAG: hypothetical protein ABSE51_19930 [Terracidiphilus sp.]